MTGEIWIPTRVTSITGELSLLNLGHQYDYVIMTTMASEITSLTVVYSTVYSDADQRKHQNSASLAFVCGIHRDRWIPRTKGQLRGKCLHLMTSSWWLCNNIRQKPIQYDCISNPNVNGCLAKQGEDNYSHRHNAVGVRLKSLWPHQRPAKSRAVVRFVSL